MAEAPISNDILTERPRETTRVILVDDEANVFTLQKSEHSVARGMNEFPGGNIDGLGGRLPTLREQKLSAAKETQEESGFDVPLRSLRKAEDFSYTHNGVTRNVHVFVARVPGIKPEFTFGQMKDENGFSLDLHSGGSWVSRDELEGLKREHKLLGNSLRFRKALRLAETLPKSA